MHCEIFSLQNADCYNSIIQMLFLQALSFPVKHIRIEVDCTAANTWVEIDAVQMRGKKHRSGTCNFVNYFLLLLCRNFCSKVNKI